MPESVREEGPTLSANRVRMLSARRRAMIRVRTWWAVAGGVLAMAAGGLGWGAAAGMWGRGGVSGREVALGLIAGACVVGFTLVARQVAAVSRAIAGTELGEPEAPPDFSGLGDGSERWRRLEEIVD